MAPVGFEPTIPTSEPTQAYVLYREDTGTGNPEYTNFYCEFNWMSSFEITMKFVLLRLALPNCMPHTISLCTCKHAPHGPVPICLSQFHSCCCLLSLSIHFPLYEVGPYWEYSSNPNKPSHTLHLCDEAINTFSGLLILVENVNIAARVVENCCLYR
jgi:hypothetical protein